MGSTDREGNPVLGGSTVLRNPLFQETSGIRKSDGSRTENDAHFLKKHKMDCGKMEMMVYFVG